MNVEPNLPKKEKNPNIEDFNLEDFDFKPITSGLGFHHPKIQDVKPVFTDRTLPLTSMPTVKQTSLSKTENPVYQNDLSLFYQGKNSSSKEALTQEKMIESDEKLEEVVLQATRTQRLIAYSLDLGVVACSLSLVLVVMSKIIDLDIVEAWELYPHEMTPLSVALFCGFYLIYFSIFEKGNSSTLGKNIMSIRVVDQAHRQQNMGVLFLRTFISLINFLTLGLFSWFDLQDKITGSKVIRVK